MRPNYFKGFLVCLGALVLFSALICELDVSNDALYRYSSYSSTPKRSLTKEEADSLRGTGYNGTRPNSATESMESAAVQAKCDVRSMHSANGYNSACNSHCEKGYH